MDGNEVRGMGIVTMIGDDIRDIDKKRITDALINHPYWEIQNVGLGDIEFPYSEQNGIAITIPLEDETLIKDIAKFVSTHMADHYTMAKASNQIIYDSYVNGNHIDGLEYDYTLTASNNNKYDLVVSMYDTKNNEALVYTAEFDGVTPEALKEANIDVKDAFYEMDEEEMEIA